MKPRFVGILAVAVVLIVVVSAFLVLMGSGPGGSASVTPCRVFRFFLSPLLVPPGQTVLVGSSGINLSNAPGPAPQWQFSFYANSTTPYALYLLSQDQYSSYTASGSGTTPPSSYYWESGIETATNTTVLVANGIWYPMAYNPGTARAIVTVQTAQCGVTP